MTTILINKCYFFTEKSLFSRQTTLLPNHPHTLCNLIIEGILLLKTAAICNSHFWNTSQKPHTHPSCWALVGDFTVRNILRSCTVERIRDKFSFWKKTPHERTLQHATSLACGVNSWRRAAETSELKICAEIAYGTTRCVSFQSSKLCVFCLEHTPIFWLMRIDAV